MFTTLENALRTCLVTLGTLVVLACSASAAARHSDPRAERMQIESIEIRPTAGQSTNAYDVVRTLRPWMLVMRDQARLLRPVPPSPNDSRGIRVYLDDVSVGGVEVLHSIPSDAIVLIQWLSAIDATTRYGAGHMAGVIAVTTGAHRF